MGNMRTLSWRLWLLVFTWTWTWTGGDAQLDVCGVAPLNTKIHKIVGGEAAAAGAWPWQASLTRSGSHFCGGSLINNQWVLTAAHCFPGASTTDLVVYLGRETQDQVNSNEASRTVTRIINHPDYDSDTSDNDVSLLRLDRTVDFTQYIRPVCLAASGSTFSAGLDVWVTGWGDTATGVTLPFPGRLQEVSVPIVSNAQCSANYETHSITINANMLCAGLAEGGKDSCQGDSGGPLVYKNTTVWVLGGVVSFGVGCALPNTPGVYARVSRYQTWIDQHVTDNRPGYVCVDGGDCSSAAHREAGPLPLLMSLPLLVYSMTALA